MSTTLPVDTFAAGAADLRRPFDPLALKWKVQTQWGPKDGDPTGGLIVCYIDRGLVIDRLNLVIPGLWETEFAEMERNHMRCAMTVDGLTRSDVGEGGTYKARYSDALKRAAVHFGVGVSLSRVPQSRLNVSDGKLKVKGKHLEITQAGLDYLRERYKSWLDQVGNAAFGDPLLHGDLGEAQGDDEIPDESIIEDRDAVDLYVSLSEAGLTLRQQVGLVNQAGGQIQPNAGTVDVAKAVASLTEDQADALGELIAKRMDARDRER
jgi:hypothetical protein